MKKRFWKFLFAVLAAYALQGAELGNKDKVHAGPSVRRVDLLAGSSRQLQFEEVFAQGQCHRFGAV